MNNQKIGVEEITKLMGNSNRNARYNLKKLFEKGYIQRKKKGPQIGFKYVYYLDTKQVYKTVFRNETN